MTDNKLSELADGGDEVKGNRFTEDTSFVDNAILLRFSAESEEDDIFNETGLPITPKIKVSS